LQQRPLVISGSDAEWQTQARNDPNQFLSSLVESLTSPNPNPKAGPSVEDMFKLHLSALAQVSKENKNLPTLYSIMKTFWLPASPSYFCLFAAENAKISNYRFLYWDPLPITWTGIKCPSCQTALAHSGRIRTGPIKIYDFEKPFFIIGCEYNCPNQTCARIFASTDYSILRSIPPLLRSEFPARLVDREVDVGPANVWDWRGRGVSTALWKVVKGCLDAGLDKDKISQNVLSIVQHSDVEDEEGEESTGDHTEDESASAVRLSTLLILQTTNMPLSHILKPTKTLGR
jgi:hypothetical protein